MKKGWKVDRLEELLTLNQIGLVRNKKEQDPDFEFRYFKMDNIRNDNGIKEEGFSFVNASAEEVSKYSLKNGDLLFNTRNSFELVGKSCLYSSEYQSPTIFNNNIMRMRFTPNLISSYAAYAFSSELVLDQLEKIKSGTTSVVGIYFKTLKNIRIPIPPLSEQEEIVEVLDKAFAAIDQAKANIEQNIANAKELFQSKLNQIFSQKGEGWEMTKLSAITSKIGSGATPRGGQAAYKESGISLIRSLNVYDAGFTPAKLAFIDDSQAEKLKNVIVEMGDVLINITGASVARCCAVESKYLPARVNQHVSILRPNIDQISSKYLHLYLISPEAKSSLLGIGDQGATRQAITKSQLQNFPIPLPPLPEQKTIVKQLDALSESTNQLQSHYQTKLASLDELKKSILQKAFAGELT